VFCVYGVAAPLLSHVDLSCLPCILVPSRPFHTGNKLSKANIVDASFDVCKHCPTDQSQRSISEISSAKFCKIEHVVNCEIKSPNLVLSKVDCSH